MNDDETISNKIEILYLAGKFFFFYYIIILILLISYASHLSSCKEKACNLFE